MINNHGSNITLTPEQSAQLEEWKARLAIIQEEIKKADSIRTSLNDDIEVCNKNKVYLDEVAEGLKVDIKRLELLKESLRLEVSQSANLLEAHIVQTTKHATHLRGKEKEHGEREETIAKKEKELSKIEEDHAVKAKKLAEQQLLVDKARDAFLKATEHVSWK